MRKKDPETDDWDDPTYLFAEFYDSEEAKKTKDITYVEETSDGLFARWRRNAISCLPAMVLDTLMNSHSANEDTLTTMTNLNPLAAIGETDGSSQHPSCNGLCTGSSTAVESRTEAPEAVRSNIGETGASGPVPVKDLFFDFS